MVRTCAFSYLLPFIITYYNIFHLVKLRSVVGRQFVWSVCNTCECVCFVACNCNVYGSVREDCDQTTGRCVCKKHVAGLKCDRCSGIGRKLRPFGCSSKLQTETAGFACQGLYLG